MTKDEALKLALEALESYERFVDDAHIIEGQWHWLEGTKEAIAALRQALEQQPAGEPVAYMVKAFGAVQKIVVRADVADEIECELERGFGSEANVQTLPLYTRPQPAAWVGLTQQDIDIAFDDTQEGGGFNEFAYAIEAKLREKNGGN